MSVCASADERFVAFATDEEQDVPVEGAEVTAKPNENPNLCRVGKQTATSTKRKKRNKKSGGDPRSMLLQKARFEFEKADDEYEAIGKIVATKLRKIRTVNHMQFIYVDKIIKDTLYKALLQQLTPSDFTTQDKSQIPTYNNDASGNTASSSSSSQSYQSWQCQSSPVSSHVRSLHSSPPPLLYFLRNDPLVASSTFYGLT